MGLRVAWRVGSGCESINSILSAHLCLLNLLIPPYSLLGKRAHSLASARKLVRRRAADTHARIKSTLQSATKKRNLRRKGVSY